MEQNVKLTQNNTRNLYFVVSCTQMAPPSVALLNKGKDLAGSWNFKKQFCFISKIQFKL